MPVVTWVSDKDSATNCEVTVMLYYALAFFIVALIAAVFGFTGIAAGAAAIAKILFFIFLAVAAVTFIASLVQRRA
jgi:uncharacterized membrane protein YtjA (UPF0391 family)